MEPIENGTGSDLTIPKAKLENDPRNDVEFGESESHLIRFRIMSSAGIEDAVRSSHDDGAGDSDFDRDDGDRI